jgi:hypothetical protein
MRSCILPGTGLTMRTFNEKANEKLNRRLPKRHTGLVSLNCKICSVGISGILIQNFPILLPKLSLMTSHGLDTTIRASFSWHKPIFFGDRVSLYSSGWPQTEYWDTGMYHHTCCPKMLCSST